MTATKQVVRRNGKYHLADNAIYKAWCCTFQCRFTYRPVDFGIFNEQGEQTQCWGNPGWDLVSSTPIRVTPCDTPVPAGTIDPQTNLRFENCPSGSVAVVGPPAGDNRRLVIWSGINCDPPQINIPVQRWISIQFYRRTVIWQREVINPAPACDVGSWGVVNDTGWTINEIARWYLPCTQTEPQFPLNRPLQTQYIFSDYCFISNVDFVPIRMAVLYDGRSVNCTGVHPAAPPESSGDPSSPPPF